VAAASPKRHGQPDHAHLQPEARNVCPELKVSPREEGRLIRLSSRSRWEQRPSLLPLPKVPR